MPRKAAVGLTQCIESRRDYEVLEILEESQERWSGSREEELSLSDMPLICEAM